VSHCGQPHSNPVYLKPLGPQKHRQSPADCTGRRNLRNCGAGDIFFSYQSKVCAKSYSASSSYSAHMRRSSGYRSEIELTGMSVSGGVGY
jgi:hypothetical protein